MTTAPHTTPITWRDLADQLTPDQVAYLEMSERHPVPMADGTVDIARDRQGHLFAAREMISQNFAAVLYADVPPPIGATKIDPWHKWGDDWCRLWLASVRTVPISSTADDNARVAVCGSQTPDGVTERGIVLWCGDDTMIASEARQLAAALIAAANELDAITTSAVRR